MSKVSTQRKKVPTKRNKGSSKKPRKNGTPQVTGVKVPLRFAIDADTFFPDVENVANAFDDFNVLFFGGTIQPPCFEVDDLDTEWGYFVPATEGHLVPLLVDGTEWVLGVRDRFPSVKKFHEVVLHEMVHAWQVQFDCETPHHGRTFDSWVIIIKEYGYEI